MKNAGRWGRVLGQAFSRPASDLWCWLCPSHGLAYSQHEHLPVRRKRQYIDEMCKDERAWVRLRSEWAEA